MILPIRWSDNYVTLLPGERRVLVARFEGPDWDPLYYPPAVDVQTYNHVVASKRPAPGEITVASAPSPAPMAFFQWNPHWECFDGKNPDCQAHVEAADRVRVLEVRRADGLVW